MKKVILAVVLIFASCISLSAQEKSIQDSLKGKFALQFRIAENFTLSSFQGGIFSGKYYFSEKSSLRLGLSITTNSIDSEISRNSVSSTNPINIEENTDSDNKVYFYGVNLQYIYNLKTTEDITFFTGFGPFFGFSNNDNDYVSTTKPNTYDRVTERKRTEKQTVLGINLLCGIEWFVKSNISISAEYGIDFSYNLTKIDEKNIDKYTVNNSTSNTNTKTVTSSIDASNVNFGVSFYF